MKYALRSAGVLTAVLGLALVPGYAEAATNNSVAYVGKFASNVEGGLDWSHTYLYVDVVKSARYWGNPSQEWVELAPNQIGADGWPTTDFGLVLFADQAGLAYRSGTYKIKFTGKLANGASGIQLGYGGSGSATITNFVYNASTNTTTADLNVPAGMNELRITFRNTNSGSGPGLKDLKIISPGYDVDTTQMYRNEIIEYFSRYKMLRTMDLLQTNGTGNGTNPNGTWATRNTPISLRVAPSSTSPGHPIEHAIELANETGSDIWLNIPVKADDDYIKNLALLVKANLKPTIKVYLEFSNEVWNYSFPQWRVNYDAAQEEAKDIHSVLRAGGANDGNVFAWRRVGERLITISNIFRATFGDEAMMTRVRPVFATQMWMDQQTTVFDMIRLAYPNPPSYYFYGTAIAPYFNLDASELGGKNLQTVEGSSVDDLLTNFMLTSNAVVDQYGEYHAALAKQYGLKSLSYEGGSDSFGSGSINAKKQAELDPRMKDICLNYLTKWYQAGNQGFSWFQGGATSYGTQYGRWGLTYDIADMNAPKQSCVDDFLASPKPAVVTRHHAPSVFTSNETLPQAITKSTTRAWWYRTDERDGNGNQNFVEYAFSVPKKGNATINLLVGGASGTFAFKVNNVTTVTGTLNTVATQAGWWGDLKNPPKVQWQATGLTIPVTKGLNVVRIYPTTKGDNSHLYLDSIKIEQP